MEMNTTMKVFYRAVHVRGNLISTYVFEDSVEMKKWIQDILPNLRLKYGNINYSVSHLDGLKIGDICKVMGEGLDRFEIMGLKKYSDNRWGFVLDNGTTEEVNKCYNGDL